MFDLFAPEVPSVQPRELWPHQERGLNELRQALRAGFTRIMCQAPTGAGKTVLSAEMVRGALAKGKRIVFTVPAVSLVNQTVKEFAEEGIRAVGVEQADHELRDRSQPVQVCSVQTLQARRRIPPADLVIIDEAHKRFAFLNRWMMDPDWARVPFVGLSATPWAKGLGEVFQTLVVIATVKELIEAGRLSPFKVYAPSHPDLTGVKIVAGEGGIRDYQISELSAVMSERKLIADVVETWKKLGTRNKTLCFAVDCAHAASIQEQFCAAGVDCALIQADTDADERNRIADGFHAGSIEVVVSIGTLIAGIDWDVRTISWCRPTKSEMIWVQAFGRALRLGKGGSPKAHAIVLDHADTALTLGLPTEIHHVELDDGQPKTKEQKASEEQKPKLPTECKACHAVKPPGVVVCPECGFKPEKQTDVIVEDGELVELGSKAPAKEKYTEAQKQLWFSAFLAIAETRGYKGAWAENQFRTKFRAWPDGLSNVSAEPPTEVWNWIKSRQIAWAKSKHRRAA